MLHDLDESRSGDFQRPFKYSDETLKHELDKAAEREMKTLLHPLLVSVQSRRSALTVWTLAKDTTREGCIVALADFLGVLSYLWQEITCLNVTVLQQHSSMIEYADLFNQEPFEFLRPLINDIQKLAREVLNREQTQEVRP